MAVIPLGETPAPSKPPRGFVPFALGFRPFFALAAVSGMLLMLLWLWFWLNSPVLNYYSAVGWHTHEMLFGFTMAIVAGFLLTAVRNWTGIDTPTGKPLALLALLWVAGRLFPFIPSIPAWLVVCVDWLFIPALIIALTRPLIKAENRVNRLFIPLLSAMAIANLLYHLEGLGLTQTGQNGISLMRNLVLLLLIFVGGRVLPFFTEKAIQGAAPRFSKQREQFIYTLFTFWIVAELLLPQSWLIAPLALGVAITQAWRLYDWYHPGIWQQPMLWILFCGLIWMVIGFLLKAMALYDLYPNNLATHAFTVGAIGIITLGMMARVSLGHTGRSIDASKSIITAFILINIAVAIRVFLPATNLLSYQACITISGAAWSISYLLFAITYVPILLRPRIDGRPG
ncbi:MAG: NnrS family protein [Candidatus Thiodiazotropha sp. L084R]